MQGVPFKLSLFLSVALATLAATAPASAEETPSPGTVSVARVESETRWYGWQTLLVDAGVFVAGTALYQANGGEAAPSGERAALTLGTLGAFAVGSPLVHVAHGHWDRAGISAGMRAGGWFVGGLAGAGLGALVGTDGSVGTGLGLGVLAGLIAPVVIDAAVLSKEKVPAKPRDASFTPTASVTPNGGGMVGAVGTF